MRDIDVPVGERFLRVFVHVSHFIIYELLKLLQNG